MSNASGLGFFFYKRKSIMNSKRITPRERFIAEKFPATIFRILAYMNRQARNSATGYKRPSGRHRNIHCKADRVSILREFLSY